MNKMTEYCKINVAGIPPLFQLRTLGGKNKTAIFNEGGYEISRQEIFTKPRVTTRNFGEITQKYSGIKRNFREIRNFVNHPTFNLICLPESVTFLGVKLSPVVDPLVWRYSLKIKKK
jgi:hypothetical protein